MKSECDPVTFFGVMWTSNGLISVLHLMRPRQIYTDSSIAKICNGKADEMVILAIRKLRPRWTGFSTLRVLLLLECSLSFKKDTLHVFDCSY